jgi:hypothetical protein
LKQLLIETMPSGFAILEAASEKNGGRIKIGGTFDVADEVNGNGRLYSETLMDREVEKLNRMIENCYAYGEADHPGDGKSTIKNTAARFTKKIEKKVVDGRKVYVGEAIILRTEPGGKNLQEMIESGGKVGVSKRGWGSLVKGSWKGESCDLVQSDYTLKTFDFVLGQSTKGAEVTQVSEQMEVVNLFEAESYDSKANTEQQNKKGGNEQMEIKTVEELRKAYPDLCEQLVKDAVAAKEKEVKESLQKDFDSRVLKEVEAKTEEIKGAVIEEIKASEEFQGMVGTLTEIGKLVKPYISEETEDVDEIEKKLGEIKGELDTVKGENKALKEQIENDKKSAETKEKVKAKITELTAGKKHEKLLAEALESCKTVEEVDTRFKQEEARIQKITETLNLKEDPKGKGKVLNEDLKDEKLNEEKKRQRDLAGVDEDVAKQKGASA